MLSWWTCIQTGKICCCPSKRNAWLKNEVFIQKKVMMCLPFFRLQAKAMRAFCLHIETLLISSSSFICLKKVYLNTISSFKPYVLWAWQTRWYLKVYALHKAEGKNIEVLHCRRQKILTMHRSTHMVRFYLVMRLYSYTLEMYLLWAALCIRITIALQTFVWRQTAMLFEKQSHLNHRQPRIFASNSYCSVHT